MSEADDLRREASDPATSPERLRQLCQHEDAGWTTATAALRNPSLPLDVLRSWLTDREPAFQRLGRQVAAWHNPAVLLLLMSEPHPDLREGARLLLARLGTERDPVVSLEQLIEDWSQMPPGGHVRSEHARSFARHLAGLFGLTVAWGSPGHSQSE
jgi:hypothetical protein